MGRRRGASRGGGQESSAAVQGFAKEHSVFESQASRQRTRARIVHDYEHWKSGCLTDSGVLERSFFGHFRRRQSCPDSWAKPDGDDRVPAIGGGSVSLQPRCDDEFAAELAGLVQDRSSSWRRHDGSDADSDPDADSDSDPSSYCYGDTDVHADSGRYSHCHCDGNLDPNRDGDRDSNSNRNRHCNGVEHANIHTDGDCDTNGDRDCNSDTHGDRDSNRNRIAYAHGDSHRDCNLVAHTDSDRHFDSGRGRVSVTILCALRRHDAVADL